MTKKTSLENSTEAESALKAPDENLPDNERLSEPVTVHSRKPALSKREIMEELSRERFPWDE